MGQAFNSRICSQTARDTKEKSCLTPPPPPLQKERKEGRKEKERENEQEKEERQGTGERPGMVV